MLFCPHPAVIRQHRKKKSACVYHPLLHKIVNFFILLPVCSNFFASGKKRFYDFSFPVINPPFFLGFLQCKVPGNSFQWRPLPRSISIFMWQCLKQFFYHCLSRVTRRLSSWLFEYFIVRTVKKPSHFQLLCSQLKFWGLFMDSSFFVVGAPHCDQCWTRCTKTFSNLISTLAVRSLMLGAKRNETRPSLPPALLPP